MNYYSIAALALTLIVYALRKLPGLKNVWQKIPDGWRWLVPTLAGALAGLIPLVQSGASVKDIAMALLAGLFGISLPAMGVAAAVKDSPLPIDGGAGGVK
jgi:TctA family transporter